MFDFINELKLILTEFSAAIIFFFLLERLESVHSVGYISV